MTDPGNSRFRRLAELGLAPARYARVLRASDRTPLLQVVKTAVAASLAWIVCLLVLPGDLPIFGTIAAILVVQPSINQSFSKALERTVGVIAGVVIASLAAAFFGVESWLILASILVSLLLGWAFRLSQSTTAQIPISALLVLTIGAATPGYAVERVIETVLGAAIAVVVNVIVVPPVRLRPAQDAIAALGAEVANSLDDLARLIREPSTAKQRMSALVTARLLRPMELKAVAAVTGAEESLRFNPRRSVHRSTLATDHQLLDTLHVLVLRVPGMIRALDDRYDETIHTEPTAAGLSTEVARAAHDLRLVMQQAEPEEAATDEVPTLTEPFTVLAPSAAHWILIGSLLEDLRRVREVIVEASDDRTP
ncbi:aromatic acid exporter family protein [Conyzicola nivalis]|uniref:FUSC family protein n=1 Tax=Conyzicola nivalis TaxID=1477021 RepID=A0A916WFZ4_9MICO|nr:FUSC family protein [Conyzicola nivalis]GGA95647.1 FUSC family protein [Conyzicola nivalis]